MKLSKMNDNKENIFNYPICRLIVHKIWRFFLSLYLKGLFFFFNRWSYGVVLYEIFTLGGTPYPGIAGRFLVAQLREGYRMDQPEGCPDEM